MAYEIPGKVAALQVAIGHVLDRRRQRGALWSACVTGLEGGTGTGTKASGRERTRERGLQRQGRPAAKEAPVRHSRRS